MKEVYEELKKALEKTDYNNEEIQEAIKKLSEAIILLNSLFNTSN